MKKIVATVLVALTASVMVAGSAAALPLIKLPPLKGAPKGDVTSPGDAFQPFQETADIRETCEDEGGYLKKVFDGNDFVWVCVA